MSDVTDLAIGIDLGLVFLFYLDYYSTSHLGDLDRTRIFFFFFFLFPFAAGCLQREMDEKRPFWGCRDFFALVQTTNKKAASNKRIDTAAGIQHSNSSTHGDQHNRVESVFSISISLRPISPVSSRIKDRIEILILETTVLQMESDCQRPYQRQRAN